MKFANDNILLIAISLAYHGISHAFVPMQGQVIMRQNILTVHQVSTTPLDQNQKEQNNLDSYNLQRKVDNKDKKEWSPSSWRSHEPKQMPVYSNLEELKAATDKLSLSTPLVIPSEIRTLKSQLTKAATGEAFLLMGGDCAESFKEFDVNHVRDTYKVILQMALVLTFGSGLPVIKVGRMAGQFAKPRSEPNEVKDGLSLPSYRGDIINEEDFTEEARKNDPFKMLKAFNQSVQTLNLLRAFSSGGYADINLLHAWNLDFVAKTEEGSRYRQLCTKVEETLHFMKAIGANLSSVKGTEFFTAHECLLLEYEQALTKRDETSGDWYDLSGHMLWVGERTRDLDGAHLEFTRGIENPIGVKVSDKCSPNELVEIVETMNPKNIPGRLTVIVRMGAEKIRSHLPSLIRAVEKKSLKVVWISDPVHGNTRKTDNGFKTRDFDAIRAELRAFFDVHHKMGTHAGGVHLEMTGEDVTECVGGLVDVTEETLPTRYNTACDPRLNGQQALELAFLISDRMNNMRNEPSSKDWFMGLSP